MKFKVSARLIVSTLMEPVARQRARECCLGQFDWQVDVPSNQFHFVQAVFSGLSKYDSKLVLAGIDQMRKLQGVSIDAVDIAVSETAMDVHEARKLLSAIRLLMPRKRVSAMPTMAAMPANYLLN
jgi:hypothetical protein